MVFDTEPAPVPREEVRETETVVPPTPDGLEPSGESGASQAAPAEKSYTIDNPRLAEEEQNPLTDPQYDDHPLVDEILELLPGSDVENIDK